MKSLARCAAGIAALLAFCGAASAQITYTSTPGLAIPDNPTVSDTITVAGGTGAITGLTVTLNITHTFDADLDIALVHNGQYLLLTTDNGSTGDNYTGTIFDDAAATAITAGVAPFTGSFRPEGGTAAANGWAGVPNPPAAVNLTNLAGWIGQDANGPWQLIIDDDLGGDTGTLINWSITVSGSIGGPTPPFGTYGASPNSVTNCGGQTSLLTVTVAPGANPASTAHTVTMDLSQIGGSATQTFYDNQTNGDVTANDNVFSYLATVPNTVTPGSKSLPFTVQETAPLARSTTGSGSLTVTSCPPLNDNCSGAFALVSGSNPFTGMTAATTDGTASCDGSVSSNDIWYTFTSASGGPVIIDTCSNPNGGTFFDSVLSVFSGTCGSLVEEACSDDFGGTCGTNGWGSKVTVTFTPGETKYIRLAAYNAASVADGTGVLTVTDVLPLVVAGNAATAQETTSVLLRATVTPGTVPLSSGVSVTGDLSTIGGGTSVAFLDDGNVPPGSGDLVAGDNIFSRSYTLPTNVLTGAYTLPIAAADAQLRTASGTLALTVTNGPNGACCNGGTCSVTRQTLCVAGDGSWQGNGTNCGGSSYNFSTSTDPFIDISFGTVLATISDADDATENVALPFTFNHLGNAYTSVNVSSNGNLQFGASNSTAYTNVAIPNTGVPNDMLAPAWDDYDLDELGGGQGTVYYFDDSAANNRVIFSWQGCSQFNAVPLDSNNFQVILYSNGNAEFRYGAMNNINNPTVVGDTVTIGYENADGTSGGEFASATVGAGNTAVVLTAAVNPSPCGPTCDTIDFNHDELFPDTLDIDDFLSVFSGGSCTNDPNCGDIDFNNDGLFPDTLDIDALLSVFSGGPCLV